MMYVWIFFPFLLDLVKLQSLIVDKSRCMNPGVGYEKNVMDSVAEVVKTLSKEVSDLQSKVEAQENKITELEKRLNEPSQTSEQDEIKIENYTDCRALQKQNPSLPDGVYNITVTNGVAIPVLCDMTDGGWTVFQRRLNGEENFYRNWTDYREGFGHPSGEYWLGNEYLHQLTVDRNCSLKIDMTEIHDKFAFAQYTNFKVDDETEGYRLKIGNYSGTAGDSLKQHNGSKFTTLDVDNDLASSNCAVTYRGGWWYWNCYYSNLNGVYGMMNFTGIRWENFLVGSDFLKRTTMKMKCD